MLFRSTFSGRKKTVVQDYSPDPLPYTPKPRCSSTCSNEFERRLRSSLLPGDSEASITLQCPKFTRYPYVWHSSRLLKLVGLMVLVSFCYLWMAPGESVDMGSRSTADLSPSEFAQGESPMLASTAHRPGYLPPKSLKQANTRGLSKRAIPRIIHQTYKVAEPPVETLQFIQSWRDINIGYQFPFYDDDGCLQFVHDEFPEYYDAYTSLPKNVERSDFFRYMILLRYGGVYADIDTECRIPMDSVVRDDDKLVVGWENEWATSTIAFNHHFVRRRQVLQWIIIAAPGHPVLREICDFVAANVHTTFSNNTNRDTLERTGPGAWTDVVLKHAMRPNAEWPVRILPRVAFGTNLKDAVNSVSFDNPDIAVLHHFLGSWKVKGGWKKAQSITESLISFATRSLVASEQEEMKDSAAQFPVSALWEPPFTVFVNLVGAGRLSGGEDISSELTIYGTWQPGLPTTRKPSVVEALAGALSSKRAKGGAFLDIGAGMGYFSLAAAARGHSVIAVELAQDSLELFKRSIQYNDFEDRITLHQQALGALTEKICLCRTDLGEVVQANHISSGYASADSHRIQNGSCTKTDFRVPLDTLLSAQEAKNIGVVRIDANGWEGWILDGMEDILNNSPPAAILLQFHPSLVPATDYAQHPADILQKLYDHGYQQISHSGTACDERWHNITRSVRARGSYLWSTDAQEALKQPTWCRLNPESFQEVTERAHRLLPENILFTHTGIRTNITSDNARTGGVDTFSEVVKTSGMAVR